jgi:hypothetical protein
VHPVQLGTSVETVPRAPTRNPIRFSPIVVLATARSYSSVVTTMIGQHPQLAGLPELKLFCCATIGELETSLPRFWKDRGLTHRSPGLVRAIAEYIFGEQNLRTLAGAQQWLRDRAEWSGADVLDVILRQLDPRVAVEKSPDNLLTDAALSRMAKAYPRARYLHLTRHPVTTQRSMEAYRLRTFGTSQEGEPMRSVAAWYEIHRRILLFANDLPPDRYLSVRAEDALNDPNRELRKVATWLGIRGDATAITRMLHPESSPFARPGPAESGVAGGNDPAFLRDPFPRRAEIPRGLDPPPAWTADATFWKMVVELANRLGYR